MTEEHNVEANAVNIHTEAGTDNSLNKTHGHGSVATAETLASTAEQPAVEEWYLSEGVKGVGEMPKGFNNKTFKNVEANLEAYAQLQKKLSEKGGAAPDNNNYELALSDTYKDVKFDDNDALMNGWKDLAAKNKFSNDQFNAGIEMWLGYVDSFKQGRQDKFAETFKELGVGGEQTLSELESWFDNSFGDVESFDTFKNKMTDAEDIKLLMKMRDAMSGANVISSNEASKPKTREYFVNLMDKSKGYGINKTYTDRVSKEFENYMKNK